MNIIIPGAIVVLGLMAFSHFASADLWEEATERREQCMDRCGGYIDYSTEQAQCEGDCWKAFHAETGQGGSQYQSLADPSVLEPQPQTPDEGWIEHGTQMAEGSTGRDGTTYGEDGSVVGQAEQPTMIAQPTGHGGWFGGGGGGGGGNGGGGTPESDPQQCQYDCGQDHTNEDAYSACINECTASAEPRVMIADLRIGDPSGGACGSTDPWSCFNGTDESPDIRNVDEGIFGVFADSTGR